MQATRVRLLELLDALTDEQVETVLRFTEALSRGRVVVSTCEVVGSDDPPPMTDQPTARPPG